MSEKRQSWARELAGLEDYQRLWPRTVRNVILGMFVSVLPGFVFYSVALSYTPDQLRLMRN